jgi:rhamnulokinase
MSSRHYLAFDLGAGSGRAMLGVVEGGSIALEEVHRFRTPLVERAGHLFWDLDALWEQLSEGLERALKKAPDLRALSVDSWAVDYVPLDRDGSPLRDPYAYRDPRTRGMPERAFSRVPAEEIYRRTGIQMQEFNTAYQVLADVEMEPDVTAATATRLLMADYFLFRWSGRRVAERSMASTTQLMDVRTGDWDLELMERLGVPTVGWPQIVPSGTLLGPLSLHGTASPPMVVAGCSHDTAAAVAAVPADERGGGWAYLSTGTWALLGVERDEPVASEQARAANFTNEAGLDGTVRFLKNLMGMWMLEECRREAAERGEHWEYPTLFAEAEAAPAPAGTLDLSDRRFAERGEMRSKVAARCVAQGMTPPSTPGELVRLLMESLAAEYARALEELEGLTGEPVEVLHVVGGASRNGLLCQRIADASGRRVVAGPTEATALGNVLIQARALGDLPPGTSIRRVVRSSCVPREYHPRDGAAPDRAVAGGTLTRNRTSS